MENIHQIIEDFFNNKIHEAISSKYDEILKPIRDKKKNHKHKENLKRFTEEEETIESNQWMREKLDKIEIIFRNEESIYQHIKKCIDLYIEKDSQNDIKEKVEEEFKELKKKLKKEDLSEQHKKSFELIDKEKIKTDKFKRNLRLLERLSEIDYDIFNAKENASIIAKEKFERNTWIANAASKAGEVNVGMTHIAKLTHSSTRASNLNSLLFGIQLPKMLLVSANSVENPPVDFAYATAEYAPIAEFLQLDCAGIMLGKIICENSSALKFYAKDDEQLKLWQEQFSLAFHDKNKSSHALSKQIYFPLSPESAESSYHLLTPLTSSSLAQVIADRIWEARRKDTPVNMARGGGMFSSEVVRMFLKTAVLKTTQTNHQNISNLNGKRSGQLILLPAIPPQWKTQTKPPIYFKTIFNKQLSSSAKEPLRELKNMLLAIKANKLSVNLQRKQIICEYITDIADIVFDYVAQIQGLKQEVGWSQTSQLPAHQQYWLDPFRPDEDFQSAKTTVDWSNDVVADFAKWVNQSIKHKQLTIGAAHEKQWKKLFVPLLREFNAFAESDFETNSIEEQK